jgi:hypothetical protein
MLRKYIFVVIYYACMFNATEKFAVCSSVFRAKSRFNYFVILHTLRSSFLYVSFNMSLQIINVLLNLNTLNNDNTF